jgi:hypothetical protein
LLVRSLSSPFDLLVIIYQPSVAPDPAQAFWLLIAVFGTWCASFLQTARSIWLYDEGRGSYHSAPVFLSSRYLRFVSLFLSTRCLRTPFASAARSPGLVAELHLNTIHYDLGRCSSHSGGSNCLSRCPSTLSQAH